MEVATVPQVCSRFELGDDRRSPAAAKVWHAVAPLRVAQIPMVIFDRIDICMSREIAVMYSGDH
jgi:hypothetical protein